MMQDRLEYLGYSVIGWLVRLMPWRSVNRFGAALASIVFYLVPIRRSLTIEHLHRAFPGKSPAEIHAIALAAYRNLVISLLEVFWFSRLTPEKVREVVRMPETSVMDARLQEGKGLIMLGGHFGNWELIAIAVGLLSKHPLTIIVQRQRNKFVDAFMNKNRTLFGNKVVEMEKAPREIISTLRNNGVVAILADQSGPREGLFVNFFGRPASTHRGPALFSVRTGAPIIMAFIIRQPDGLYNVEFEEVETKDVGGTDEEKIEQITARHVAILEEYATRYPDHWLWMHKRWKHTPSPTLPSETQIHASAE
ncbi:MAG TPA: lysophospholipid acyltransferase family protein [Bacteroidota bacterium]|nr:lysophospholipid acyltransferase family protein [Bacteroidota bacterium]